MSQKLYEKYYLPTLDDETKEVCKKISNKFGTKVFLNKDSNRKEVPQYIFDEFSKWHEASNGQAKFPNYIDLNDKVYEKFILNKDSGVYTFYNESSKIEIKKKESLEYTIRHELVHCNQNNFSESPPPDFREKFKIEFKNAGVPEHLIKYARTNMREYTAVAIGDCKDGDCSVYSKEFKKFLIEQGIPEWMFNLKPKSPQPRFFCKKFTKDFNYSKESELEFWERYWNTFIQKAALKRKLEGVDLNPLEKKFQTKIKFRTDSQNKFKQKFDLNKDSFKNYPKESKKDSLK